MATATNASSWLEPLTEIGLFVLGGIVALVAYIFKSALAALRKDMEHADENLQKQIDQKASTDKVEGIDTLLTEIAENARATRQAVDSLSQRLLPTR